MSGLYGRLSPTTGDADADKNGVVSSGELVAYLLERQKPPMTVAARKPSAYGRLLKANATVAAQSNARSTSFDWRPPPTLVASLRLTLPGLVPMQAAGALSPAVAPPCRPLTAEESSDPLRASAALLAQRSRLRTEEWSSRSDCLALGFERLGQRVVAEYGVGDQFPEDPQKLQQHDFAAAAAAFEAARNLRPSDRSLQVRELFCAGRARAFIPSELSNARGLLEKARAIQTDAGEDPIPEIDNAIGVTYIESGQFAAALPYLERAKKRRPSWVYPRHNLALADLELGNYTNAEREYREAIVNTPYYSYLHYNLGLLLQRTNRRSAARRSYEQALSIAEQAIRSWTRAAERGSAMDSPRMRSSHE